MLITRNGVKVESPIMDKLSTVSERFHEFGHDAVILDEFMERIRLDKGLPRPAQADLLDLVGDNIELLREVRETLLDIFHGKSGNYENFSEFVKATTPPDFWQ